MTLENISYFEFFDSARNIYVSLFPSNLTVFDEKSLPANESKVFTEEDVDEKKVYDILSELKKVNFGFRDFFWFVPKEIEKELTFEVLKEWLLSLYYTFPDDSEITKHYAPSIIRSFKDNQFNLKVYIKSTSLPQEAIDVIPIFVDDENQKKCVVIGTKKKSDSLIINFSDNKEVELLTVGMFGKVIFGEHLEKDEKAGMAEIRSQFKNSPIPVKKQKQVSAALRALLEEGGFVFDQENIECYYVLKHNAYGRDPRYWPFGETMVSPEGEETYWKYGYPRSSTSDTVVVMVKGIVPDVLPDPIDQIECDKPVILNCEDAMEFLYSEKYKLAFPSHYHQLEVALASDVVSKKYFKVETVFGGTIEVMNKKSELAQWVVGLTIEKAGETFPEYFFRIFSREGHCTSTSFNVDKTRVNVAVDANNVIQHVFGLF